MTEPSNDTILFAPEPGEAPRAQDVLSPAPVDLFGPPKPKRKRTTRPRSKAAPLPAAPRAPIRPEPPVVATTPEPREIKPIETRYAGCRFRSRLEARWAVFFDHLGVEWRYELEGYQLSTSERYLPDFHLPATGQWVEVKGALTHHDLLKTAVAAIELPVASRPFQIRPGVLLLGDIPRPGSQAAHTRIAALNDDILWQNVFFTTEGAVRPIGEAVVFRSYGFMRSPEESTRSLRADAIAPATEPYLLLPAGVDQAYTAARSARFEHGESG